MHKKILVHCCCGPCATSSIERLLEEGWTPVLHYQNSNIWPESENLKRLGELKKVASYYSLELVCESYDHNLWLEFIKGLENEPEHGKRCLKCFEFNLLAASKAADVLGIEHFTTTLTVSRFKSSPAIFEVGQNFEKFEPVDFKKKNGFVRSIELAKQLGLYRQQYCGCEFSYNESIERGKKNGQS